MLNSCKSSRVSSIANPPPITPAKNVGRKCVQIFDKKCPIIETGTRISTYLERLSIILFPSVGNSFFIVLKLSSAVVLIDRKNATIIEDILIIGVSVNKQMNSTTEPIM